MAFPVPTEEDFDYVQFNDGTGAEEIVAIHLAIKERAAATGHTLASGDYAEVWSAPRVWHADDSPVDGRLYLVAVLKKFYADILLLLDGDANIRWTETASSGAAIWTEASLVSDIARGPFANLLTGATEHLAFQWLHECLSRLVYARVFHGLTDIGVVTEVYNGYRFGESGFGVGIDPDQDISWGEAVADTDHSSTTVSGGNVRWFIFKQSFGNVFSTIVKSLTGKGTVNSLSVGTLVAVDYTVQLSANGFTGSSFKIRINSTTTANLVSFLNSFLLIPGNVSEFELDSTNAVNFAIETVPPPSSPFLDLSDFSNKFVRATVSGVYFYIDIGGELNDQV